jgi:PDZ domain-containing protein
MTAADDGTTAPEGPPTGHPGEPDPRGDAGADRPDRPDRPEGGAGAGAPTDAVPAAGNPSPGPDAPRASDGGRGGPRLGRGRGGRRVRWGWVAFVALAVAVAVASRVNLDYYALQPGTAQSVQQFITVPADKAHPVSHPVLLTDVEIARVTALSYLYFKLQGDTSLDQVDTVTGGTPPSEFGAQGVLEMSQAEQAAEVAALRRLGYPVPSRPAGAVVFATYPGTPAWGVLKVGDVITAVDGTPTTSATGLVDVLSRYHSGQRVVLSVEKGGTGPSRPVEVTLHDTLVDLGFGVHHREDLGVQVEDQVEYTLPIKVSIDVANIGGPSAGLAMTLGVIDALSGGDLTGGKTVAATGTMSAAGAVGDVGGVAQKTIAVERAGATIFFVPKQEYRVALSKATKSLHVYAVSSLDQALSILAAHGGSVPLAPASQPAAASAAS